MEDAIERLLHVPCDETEFSGLDSLPLFLRGIYNLKVLRVADMSFLLAAPIEKVNLVNMRKHRKKLMEISGMECAFQLEMISAYAQRYHQFCSYQNDKRGNPFCIGRQGAISAVFGNCIE